VQCGTQEVREGLGSWVMWGQAGHCQDMGSSPGEMEAAWEVWCCCGCASLCKSIPRAAVGRDSEEEQYGREWGGLQCLSFPVYEMGARTVLPPIVCALEQLWGFKELTSKVLTSESGT